jgi:hypothetical protein
MTKQELAKLLDLEHEHTYFLQKKLLNLNSNKNFTFLDPLKEEITKDLTYYAPETYLFSIKELKDKGYKMTKNAEEADVMVYNEKNETAYNAKNLLYNIYMKSFNDKKYVNVDDFRKEAFKDEAFVELNEEVLENCIQLYKDENWIPLVNLLSKINVIKDSTDVNCIFIPFLNYIKFLTQSRVPKNLDAFSKRNFSKITIQSNLYHNEKIVEFAECFTKTSNYGGLLYLDISKILTSIYNFSLLSNLCYLLENNYKLFTIHEHEVDTLKRINESFN